MRSDSFDGEFNEDTKKVLEQVCINENLEPTKENMVELLFEGDDIEELNHEKRRHWVEFEKIVRLDEYYFSYWFAEGFGDMWIWDTGFQFDLSSVHIVEPVTETKIVTTWKVVK